MERITVIVVHLTLLSVVDTLVDVVIVLTLATGGGSLCLGSLAYTARSWVLMARLSPLGSLIVAQLAGSGFETKRITPLQTVSLAALIQ